MPRWAERPPDLGSRTRQGNASMMPKPPSQSLGAGARPSAPDPRAEVTAMRVCIFATLLTPLAACGKLATSSGTPRPATPMSTPRAVDSGDMSLTLPPGDGEDAACELAPSQSSGEPSRSAMTCTWKSDCSHGGVVPLGTNVDPATIKITGQADAREYAATYERASGELHFAQWACPARSSTFVVQFQEAATESGGDAVASIPGDLDLTLYAHPCVHAAPQQRSCPAGVPAVDVVGEVASCASLGLELGDTCPAGLEKCERIAAQACESSPATVISAASYLFCRSDPFDDDSACLEAAQTGKEGS